jgi:hypothetical protein
MFRVTGPVTRRTSACRDWPRNVERDRKECSFPDVDQMTARKIAAMVQVRLLRKSDSDASENPGVHATFYRLR